MLRLFKYLFILIGVLFLFTNCKKYPKNTLWFKNPAKILGRDYSSSWILEYYSVNDIDSSSQDFLRVFREEGIYFLKGSKISNGFKCPGIFDGGSLRFSDHKKQVNFQFSLDGFHTNSTVNSNYVSQRNIFLEPGYNWKIEKLCKDQFWIITEYNNVKYEMHFK